MRHLRFSWLSLFFLTAGCARTLPTEPDQGPPPSANPLRVGDPAPDFSLRDLDGKTIALSQLTGQPVVLYFGSSTCPFFRASMLPMIPPFDLHKNLAPMV